MTPRAAKVFDGGHFDVLEDLAAYGVGPGPSGHNHIGNVRKQLLLLTLDGGGTSVGGGSVVYTCVEGACLRTADAALSPLGKGERQTRRRKSRRLDGVSHGSDGGPSVGKSHLVQSRKILRYNLLMVMNQRRKLSFLLLCLRRPISENF